MKNIPDIGQCRMKGNYKGNTVVVNRLIIPKGVRPKHPTDPINSPFHVVLLVSPLNQVVAQLASPFLKGSIRRTNTDAQNGYPSYKNWGGTRYEINTGAYP